MMTSAGPSKSFRMNWRADDEGVSLSDAKARLSANGGEAVFVDQCTQQIWNLSCSMFSGLFHCII